MNNEKNIYIENYGCTSNFFDYEVITGLLEEKGYTVTSNCNSADVLIINSCGVKQQTEDRIINRLKYFHTTKKPILVTGCLPKIHKAAIYQAAPNTYTLNPDQLEVIPKTIETILQNKEIQNRSPPYRLKIHLPKTRLNRFTEIMLISEGCLGKCTYCCTRNARGNLLSYPVSNILSSLKTAVKEGVKEIYLTSQDTGSYGIDKGIDLIHLLEKIIEIPGEYKIRIGMMNPDKALKILTPLTTLLNHEKIYRFLHIPVQSGSDKVLQHMNRLYSKSDFLKIVSFVKNKVDNITISTDIIVGYPTETDRDYHKTLDLLKKATPTITNISRYTPRPNTLASNLPSLSHQTITPRLQTISSYCRQLSLETNRDLLHKQFSAVVLDKNKKGKYIARLNNYRRVLVKTPANILGKNVCVQITDYTERYLIGVLASNE